VKRLAPLAVGLLLIFAIVYGTGLTPWRVSFNRTESLPLGFYLVSDNVGLLKRGQAVCFRYVEPDWAKGRYLPPGSFICKEVLGLPGDSVISAPHELILRAPDGAHALHLPLLEHDRKGKVLEHPEWAPKQQVPDGSLFLGSVRVPNSFDSRYLGFINRSAVVNTITPLFVFEHGRN